MQRGVRDHRERADRAGRDAFRAAGADDRVDDEPFTAHENGGWRAERHTETALVAELTVDDRDRGWQATHVSEVTRRG